MKLQHRKTLILFTAVFVISLLLACASGGGITQTTPESPSWACPSPTPKPYGEAGPVKDVVQNRLPTTVPEGPQAYEETSVYYEPWEQEYGATVSSPPYPTPTPYAIVGTQYALGQRVRVPPLYALVSARADRVLDANRQLYYIDITWNNPTPGVIVVDYVRQLRLRSITTPGGQVRSGDGWTVSADALTAANMTTLSSTILPDETTVQVPVIAPQGTPLVVEFVVERNQAQPTPTPEGTQADDSGLRDDSLQRLVVQWSNATLDVGPPCNDPGAMTPWQAEQGVSWGHDAAPVAAPPGSSRVVQLALNQIGKRYVWGTQGPEAFDCSGLMQWSYNQISKYIPRTANDQRNGLRPISAHDVQPGDLVFFAPPGSSRITHVAMFIGDQDGDGTGDVVHALSPKLGIRVTPNIFGSSYYSGSGCRLCVAGFGTVR